ncbi:PTS IIA-like nitrogen regulatory protein PtsN [Phenylobacterium kunshanense]|uniref:PTS IIA-like nitrogen-regulatory protein PtsN n=1 Tax=Phenylobacterium kunshanense TaxID=1445034 RepID=A0A328BCT9_9CAUL|nr:PTS IIA-like nitrogen regulatory protein PtsN [Phenylobacterium kunshanense]RAK64913.1 PTS IIA-like nitrogen-regulatory protein PtsN [Phenylobacterium kunshanense]
MTIGELLDRSAISTRVSAANKKKALAVIAEIAARNFGLDAGQVLDALDERETAGSTGVGHGVAVPHARLEGLERMRGVFVRLEQPIEFGSVDDQPVDLLFALFAPRNAGAEHLRALARVSRLLRQGDLREHLRKAQSADAIHALLVQDVVARPAA